MRIFITGATGLIGRRLVPDRLARGDEVVVVSRNAARARARLGEASEQHLTIVEGDPVSPGDWQGAIDGCDAVIHLAGAGVADRRWTATYKRMLIESRVLSAQQVVSAMAAAARRPRVLVGGSAIGYYGDTGDGPVDESAPPGQDFLAGLCLMWEAAAGEARKAGVRVVHLRTGVVLDSRGGPLAGLMTPFRLFLGGPVGSGRQFVSWIHWHDLIDLIDLALTDSTLNGPLNGTAPNPVTSREFAMALGRAMGRPSWLPVPAPLLRVVLGEFGRYAVVNQRIIPAAAQQRGYEFRYPEISAALAELVHRRHAGGAGGAAVDGIHRS